jgi:hypothetical protein
MTWDWSMVGELMFVVGLALMAMGAIAVFATRKRRSPMTRDEIHKEREMALAKLLLRRFRSHADDVPLPELLDLFRREPVRPGARFGTYAGFASWLKRHPSLTVGMDARGTCRGYAVLRLDAAAAMFVGAKTGESLHVDFQALRSAPEFTPWGDPSFTIMQHEGA